MASRTVSNHCAPANPMTSPEASRSPTKHPKTSKVKTLEEPAHKSQDSLRSLVKQTTGYKGPSPFQPKTCYCLNLCLLPPAQQLTPIHSPIPEATSVFFPEDSLTELQLMDQICASKKSLSLVKAPPVKPPQEVAKRPMGRTQSQSKNRDKEMLGFSINLVLSNSDLSAPNIPEHLPIPEATEVAIPVNPC